MKAPLLNMLIPSMLAYTFTTTPGFAQAQRNVKKTIIITNGDTTINGKRLADMDKKGREKYQKEFNEKEKQIIEEEIDALIKNGHHGELVIRKFRNGSAPFDIRLHRFDDDSLNLSTDSISWHFRKPLAPEDVLISPEDVLRGPMHFSDRLVGRVAGEHIERPVNSQSFHFSSTDKDGVVTNIDFRISEADKEQRKKITGKDVTEDLPVDDVTLLPGFSSGKTGISFHLPNKGSVTVTITDSDDRTVFADKVNNFSGIYMQQVNLVKNGVYHLAISQNGKWSVKKVIKR